MKKKKKKEKKEKIKTGDSDEEVLEDTLMVGIFVHVTVPKFCTIRPVHTNKAT